MNSELSPNISSLTPPEPQEEPQENAEDVSPLEVPEPIPEPDQPLEFIGYITSHLTVNEATNKLLEIFQSIDHNAALERYNTVHNRRFVWIFGLATVDELDEIFNRLADDGPISTPMNIILSTGEIYLYSDKIISLLQFPTLAE